MLRFAGGHGYEDDGPAGSQLLGARYYDPTLGRFLSPDPIGHAGGLNLYGYCGNDPVNKVDPSGLIDDESIVRGAEIIGGVVGHLGAPVLAIKSGVFWDPARPNHWHKLDQPETESRSTILVESSTPRRLPPTFHPSSGLQSEVSV